MALFDIETFEAGGWIDIIDELTWMEKPETSELPKTDKERKENIERFRKYGYIIDQSIEDVFVMMKTERFSYKQNWVLKKYSRLVPVFDLSKASWKTIEELNAKIYGDNSEKVLSRKWKWGYVGVMESWKIVYKSWKSMNFSTKNLIKETVSEATQQQTTSESGTAWVSNTPTTNSNFNDWIKIGQNSDEDLVIPYARKWSNVKPENWQQIDQTISEPSAQQEVKPVAKDAEQVESS